MSKVVGAISLSLVLASAGAGWSQEVGTVTALPNAVTDEVSADTTAQPNGEKVYIVRDGALVSQATVKSAGGQGGTVLSLPSGAAAAVQVGDQIALTPPAGSSVVTTTKTTKVTTEVGAPEPAPIAVSVPGPPPPPMGAPQLDKTAATFRKATIQPVMAQSTPRGMGVPVFPAPAKVSTEAGIVAPYGQGLAAAAPVGTPYLRSPAFAGPPTIYMPQTVTRVLLPGATPYPSNIMSPPANYVYASAPFLRTDIYTSLPYGTFYWPQGYAGTTPVEPQVPAYVTAPASPIMSTQADYAAGRYVPGMANDETLNPITAGINSNLVASTALSTEIGGTAASVEAVPSLTIVQPDAQASVPTPAPVNPFPVLSDSATPAMTPVVPDVSATLPSLPTSAVPTPAPSLPAAPVATPAAVPSLPELPPAPGSAPALPNLPATNAEPGLPSLPAQPATTSAATLPSLPAAPATQVATAGLPTLPATASTPASMMPSLPQTSAAPTSQIVVDDKTPGGLTTVPAEGWVPSASTDSYEDSSLIANVEPGTVKTATFNVSVPADGVYKVELSFVGAPQFRSNAVPVSIVTATGPQKLTVDQTQTGQWHDLGNFSLKAGQNVPLITLSTEGLDGAGSNVSISADAVRLTPIS